MVGSSANRYVPSQYYGPKPRAAVARSRKSGFSRWTKAAACTGLLTVVAAAGLYEVHRTPAPEEVAAISANAEKMLESAHKRGDAITTYSVNGKSFGVVGDKAFSEEFKVMKDAITGSKGVPLVLFVRNYDSGQVTTTAAAGSGHPALADIRRDVGIFARVFGFD